MPCTARASLPGSASASTMRSSSSSSSAPAAFLPFPCPLAVTRFCHRVDIEDRWRPQFLGCTHRRAQRTNSGNGADFHLHARLRGCPRFRLSAPHENSLIFLSKFVSEFETHSSPSSLTHEAHRSVANRLISAQIARVKSSPQPRRPAPEPRVFRVLRG